jgi:RNA polymerase sigma-70 factor, ECF subfamily
METILDRKDEASMIAAILAGDSRRYHDLIRPYERTVYRMALSLMKNEADAEDVAQEALLRAFRNLSGFRGEAKFSTWLITITLNEARGRLRRRGAVQMESLDEPESERASLSPALLGDWREIPSAALERMEVRQLLQTAVSGLPEIYRQVFVLRDVEAMSVIETAEALSISIPSVKVRLHRARVMLQGQLSPQLKVSGRSNSRGGSHGHRVQTCLGSHLRLSGQHTEPRDEEVGAEAS